MVNGSVGVVVGGGGVVFCVWWCDCCWFIGDGWRVVYCWCVGYYVVFCDFWFCVLFCLVCGVVDWFGDCY